MKNTNNTESTASEYLPDSNPDILDAEENTRRAPDAIYEYQGFLDVHIFENDAGQITFSTCPSPRDALLYDNEECLGEAIMWAMNRYYADNP